MFAHIPRFQSWSTRGKHAYGIIAHHGKPGSTLRRSKRYFQSAGCRLVESSECRRSLPKKKRPLRGAYSRSPRMAWDRNVSAGTSTDLAHRLHRRGASLPPARPLCQDIPIMRKYRRRRTHRWVFGPVNPIHATARPNRRRFSDNPKALPKSSSNDMPPPIPPYSREFRNRFPASWHNG